MDVVNDCVRCCLDELGGIVVGYFDVVVEFVIVVGEVLVEDCEVV